MDDKHYTATTHDGRRVAIEVGRCAHHLDTRNRDCGGFVATLDGTWTGPCCGSAKTALASAMADSGLLFVECVPANEPSRADLLRLVSSQAIELMKTRDENARLRPVAANGWHPRGVTGCPTCRGSGVEFHNPHGPHWATCHCICEPPPPPGRAVPPALEAVVAMRSKLLDTVIEATARRDQAREADEGSDQAAYTSGEVDGLLWAGEQLDAALAKEGT